MDLNDLQGNPWLTNLLFLWILIVYLFCYVYPY